MVNKTIGQIISKGGTTEQLRKEFPDFEPTKEYFCNLGYKESTANNYLCRLRNNDKQCAFADLDNNTSIQATEEVSDNEIIKSENVDFNNLLVDTCVLAHSEAESLIEQAKHVTFINSTLEEMDKHKSYKNNAEGALKKFAIKIKKYTNKILADSEKYMLSTFSGLHDERYPDNILLQYILILPKQIRPTLLTADKNLGMKARMWDLQYILLDMAEDQKEGIYVDDAKKLGLGIWTTTSVDGTIYVENRGNFEGTVINQKGAETVICKDKVKVESGDKIHVHYKEGGIEKDKYFEIN